MKNLLGVRMRTTPGSSRRPEPRLPGVFSGDAVLWVKSETKYISAVRALLNAVCASTILSDQDRDDLKLAVGEAVCNAMQHGSPNGSRDYVCVAFAVRADGVTVSVSDCGGPFAKKCRTRRMKAPRERGYGLLIINKLSSAVRIDSNGRGTTVTMEKRFPIAV